MFSLFRRRANSHPSRRNPRCTSLAYESLEARQMLATFAVTTLSDSGAGSLRQAIIDANATAGADAISFDVAGTINLESSLPKIIDQVDLDGTTAPGFTTTPVVAVDFNGSKGLRFYKGASGSSLNSLALVDASSAGVKLKGVDSIEIVGNYIGLDLGGAAHGNGGAGIDVVNSFNIAIGGDTAVERNVISANHKEGIRLKKSAGNQISGNYIGTNVAGTAAVGNGGDGIKLKKSTLNLIGGDGTTFQLSNVISGNGSNGITLHKATDNVVAMNYIGTDATGAVDLGNAENGVLVTKKSADNLIGGEETGGNDPTGNVFVRPPQGNLISGNDQNGVLLNRRSTANQISGNYIGTAASGNSPLGNALDGVSIHKADGNSLIGCTITDDPFVFYNVIAGNGGNGVRVNKADDTTIHANFFGMGADNDTAVGNAANGILVEGNSTRTQVGGPIPLGNVVAANLQNGIVVQDKASFFVSYNTFCGLAAFSDDLTFGNGQDGMLITTKGGNILIRTNVITRNGDDGIEVSGKAKDVRIAGNIIGLNTNGTLAMGNLDNGVEIGGKAHDILVGGPQPTFNIIPENTISANGANGVAILDSAHDNIVSNGYIGLDVFGLVALGNAAAGVYLGPGTHDNTIGSEDPTLPTVISGNDGNGILLSGTHDNTVLKTDIGVAADGTTARGNGANGILINGGSYDNQIGDVAADWANLIANNTAGGVAVASGSGNAILGNSIFDNTQLGIDLLPGANLNQAAPVLLSVQAVSGGLQFTGTLNSGPKSDFTIQFFANDDNAPSGQYLLGSLVVTTNSSGLATFTHVTAAAPGGATFFTATATDSEGNTSEFSAVIS